MSSILDKVFLSLLTVLLLGTPFAIGSTPPPAYSAMEAGIFALVVVWMAKLILISREQGAGSGESGGQRSVVGGQREALRAVSDQRSEISKSVSDPTSDLRPLTSGAVAFALLVGLVAFQLVPIPPSLMRILSPHTYEFYTKIFYNWPQQAPYADLPVAAPAVPSTVLRTGADQRSEVSKTREAKSSTPSPNSVPSVSSVVKNSESSLGDLRASAVNKSESQSSVLITQSSGGLLPQTWLPLTLAPYLTKLDLLKLLAYGALFFLILRYPYGATWERGNAEPSPLGNLSPDQRLLRWVVVTVLASGFLVAFVGFIQRFVWNGKILWFYEPWDHSPAGPGVIIRASGPFVNPDHFANYLALILPIALAFTLFRFSLANKDRQHTIRILAGGVTVLIFTSILLSLSRGALAAVCMSIAVLASLAPWGSGKQVKAKVKHDSDLGDLSGSAVNPSGSSLTSDFRPLTSGIRGWLAHSFSIARAGVVVFCGLLIVGLYFAGPSGREQVDARLNERFVDEVSLGGRSQIWRDSPKLIADFPLLGVGLGSWPEVFLRYRTDPWALNFFREAHNDYVQLMSEAGVLGFALFAWFIFAHGRRLIGGLKNISSRYLPLIAAIIAALAGMALHEWFDFNLKIPANAFLFTVLFALAVRAVTSPELRTRAVSARDQQSAVSGQRSVVGASPDILTTEAQRAQSAAGERAEDLSQSEGGHRELKIDHTGKAVIELKKNKFAFLYDRCVSVVKISPFRTLRTLCLSGETRFAFLRVLRVSVVKISALGPYAGIVACIALSAHALRQNPIPYPFNLQEADSLEEAKDNILIFPTNALYHDTLLSFLGDNPPLDWQLRELSAALWLEPANPNFRDRYASLLLKVGKTDEALHEITRSVYNAPELSIHPYLDQGALTKLPAAQQRAIEEGFRQALPRRYPGIVDSLAEFYARLGRFAEQAELYEWAAGQEKDKGKKIDYALRAGSAYAQALDFPKAERILSDAISSNRSDPRPYQYLIRDIYGAKKDLLGAQQAVAEGLRNGAPALDLDLALAEAARKADSPKEVANALAAAKSAVMEAAKEQYPFDLYIQLADGAGKVGEYEQQLAALLAALELQPMDTETLSRLANVYLAQRNYDRAVIYLERLANIQYNSAEVYYRLAQAEDARYRYASAGRAYARAIELAPDNKNYKTAYDKFKENIAQNLPKSKSIEQGVANAERGGGRGEQGGSSFMREALAKEPPARNKARTARR